MLPRARQLLTADRLAALVLPAPANPGLPLLLECGCGERAQFERAHIPGAGYLDTGDVERPPHWTRIPDAELLAVLLAQGIRHDSTVILYGRNNLAAARVAQLLLYAGVDDVRLLDGGFAAWLAAGLPCESGAPRAVSPAAASAAAFGAIFPRHPEYLIDTAQARALLAQEDGILASIRTEAEHLGLTSGYNYITARGDIPGAHWARAGDNGDVNSMSACQQANGAMKPAREIEQLWRAAGITRDHEVAFYCGTGWRASMAFFYAWLMDWPRISVYDGGWCEWSADPTNPIMPISSPFSRP
ncbi:sulfurtransferase [Duganella radicis]|uniref:Sulfurtransferase n=1 Tax=Duganella radicis TaxID=551988 RepID=A0A6L6PDF9_9BURK|nr:rhodanese-like domain-containing protein [Duganella radicis]MTV37060.1 sulfurtransferase [Duganella radicis]